MISPGDEGYEALYERWTVQGRGGHVQSEDVWYMALSSDAGMVFHVVPKQTEKSSFGKVLKGKYGIYAPDFTPPDFPDDD